MVRKIAFTSLLALVGLTVSISAAPAPIVTVGGTVVDPAIFAPEKNRTLRRLGNAFKRGQAAQKLNNEEHGGIKSLTKPAVQGVVNPFTTGVGRGVAGATKCTAQFADLLGDAFATLFHVLGGVAANTEQGAGVAVANTANAVQSIIFELQSNDGLAGEVVRVVGGN